MASITELYNILARIESNSVTKNDLADLKSKLGVMQSSIDTMQESLQQKDQTILSLSHRVDMLENELAKLKTVSSDVSYISSDKEIVDLCIFGDSIIKYIEEDYLNPGGNNKKICVRMKNFSSSFNQAPLQLCTINTFDATFN